MSLKFQIVKAGFLIMALTFVGCSHLSQQEGLKKLHKKTPAKRSLKKDRQAWINLKNRKSKNLSKRVKEISAFIQNNKDKNVAVSAYLYKAEIYSKNKRPKEACKSYHQLVQSPFNYKKQWKAYRESARCYFKEKKIRQAIQTLEAFIQNPKESPANKKTAARLQWNFLKNEQAFKRWKLMSLSHLSLLSATAGEKETWRKKGEELVKSLSPGELILYADQPAVYGVFEGYILYKAGTYFFENKELNRAKEYLKKSLSSSLVLSLKREVKSRLHLINKISKVNPYLIGVLVPLSGRRKALGEKVLRGIHLGLELDKGSAWQILVMDSKSHPDVVRTQLENLFYKHNVIALIGGLTSETAEVIAEKAEELATPAVLFSQKEDLSLDRDFIFQNAITAKQLVEPLVQYVRKNSEIEKAAVLYPDDLYGKKYAELFSDMFKEEGGEIEGYEMYKTGEVDFKNPIRNLLHLNEEGREEEFEKLKEEFLKNNPHLTERSRKLTPENLLPAKQDFQAIFIPDSLDQLERIKDHLKYFGIKDIILLGTDIWRPRKIPGWKAELSMLFVNLLDAKASDIQKSSFYKNFRKVYAYSPGLFEQRAYNSAVFLKQALSKGLRSRLDLQGALKRTRKFQGAYHKIPVSEDRVFKYPLSLYKKDFETGDKLDSMPVK